MRFPVEQLRAGDVLALPSGREVTIERVDEYDDGGLVVRWWRSAGPGEPGYTPRIGSQGIGGRLDGRYLGSLARKRPGETVQLVRRGRG